MPDPELQDIHEYIDINLVASCGEINAKLG